MYIPVSQRKDQVSGGWYTPVADRASAPSLAVTPTQNNQTISRVVQAQPNATVVPPNFVGPLKPPIATLAPQSLPPLQGSNKIGASLQPSNVPATVIQPANTPSQVLQPSTSPSGMPRLP